MIATLYRLSRQDVAKLKVTDAYSIHRIVYDLFPGSGNQEEGRAFLYADKGGDFFSRTILIVSKSLPGEPAAGSLESREVPAGFLSHERYAFEVVMNPSKRDAKTSKTVAIRGQEELRQWFIGKSECWGFSPELDHLIVSRVGIQSFDHKHDGTVTQGMATFSGILTVSDREKFNASFEKGIGRCRGFGFGLLQLRPIATAGSKF